MSNTDTYPFTLPDLLYDYDDLHSHISGDIMRLHHDKHHRAYVDKLNVALEKYPHLWSRSLESILADLGSVPEDVRQTVRNNGGGHYNHSLFWHVMSPRGGSQPTGSLAEAITASYDSFDQFIEAFNDAAAGVFGSGWVWLQPDMTITTSPNQDNPLMAGGDEPLLGLDVWEHAYYLDYQNRRADYVNAWWEVVNWEFIEDRYRQ